jgi:hypothetical protein
VRCDTPIRLPGGSWFALEDVVRHSLANFDSEQELEFTAVAYSRWLPPETAWTDRYGEEHDFDQLTDALLRRVPQHTACYGCHTPYALVNLLRANERHRILRASTVRRLEARLVEVSRLLERNQDASGVWFGLWYKCSEPAPGHSRGLQAIWVTGHQLEWIALAPQRVRPALGCIKRAARALVRLLPEHSYMTAANTYPQFSHACRALALIEEVEPGAILASSPDKSKQSNVAGGSW